MSSNQGPAAAWAQAEVDGGLPIQMWARRPKDVTLDQLVQSPTRLNAWSRETVLRALTAPSDAVLEALEAAAVPDDEWRAVEPLALATIEATRAGAPTYEVDVSTRKHGQFIERHAPYHVRRLPSGGVLLATHPYRTLWQLYADALFLLGLTS